MDLAGFGATTGFGAPEAAEPIRGCTTCIRDAARATLAVTAFGTAVTFFVVWFVCSLQIPLTYACLAALVGRIVIRGWYLAFLLNVVEEAAAGERNLPELSLSDGVVEGILVPFAKFLVVGLLANVPFLLAIVYGVSIEHYDWTEAFVLAGVGVSGDWRLLIDLPPADAGVLVSCRLAGQAFLPMLLLVVAIGGFSGLVRADLMALTIGRTFPAYLLVTILFFACKALPLAIAEAAEAQGVSFDLFEGGMLVLAVMFLVMVYTDVVAMRLVGLYYRHFKRGFAWSWG